MLGTSLKDGFIVYADRHELERDHGAIMIKKEFFYENGVDLPEFLRKIAEQGWLINNEETYFLDENTTVCVAYK